MHEFQHDRFAVRHNTGPERPEAGAAVFSKLSIRWMTGNGRLAAESSARLKKKLDSSWFVLQ
jgi:hypothetical protein